MKYRTLYSSLAISTLVLLGACSQQAHYTGGAELERNTVTMVRLAHPVMAEKDGGSDLSSESIANLRHFADTNSLGYGDLILFDHDGNVSTERLVAIRKWFHMEGVTLGEFNGIYGATPTAGSVTVYVERYTVTEPNCQRWTKGTGNDPNNAPGQPFGCTTQSVLAAMVANPRDLVTGVRGSGNPGAAVRAIKTLRTSGTTSTSSETDNNSSFEGVE